MSRGFRFCITLILSLFLIPFPSEGGRSREKAGQIENGVYTDGEFGFNLTIRDNWRARISDGKGGVRLILTQNDYDVPTDYQDAPSYTKIPRVVMYVDTTSLAPAAFIDSLLSRTFKSKQKSEVLKEYDILQELELVQRGKRPVSIASLNGSRWDANAKYVKEIQTSASSVGGKRVTGSYSGTILVIRKDRTVYSWHIMSETPFHESVMTQVQEMLGSLVLGGSSNQTTDEGK